MIYLSQNNFGLCNTTGYQLFHNYIILHSALDGMTPSEKYGIEINGDNKWIMLIQNDTSGK